MSVIAAGGNYTSITDSDPIAMNSAGTLLWSAAHGLVGIIRCVAVDSNDNVYSGGNLLSSVTHRKYNSSGTLQWSANHGNTVNAIAVDYNGNVYVGGLSSSGVTHRKYNSSGVLQWSANHGAEVKGIGVDANNNVYICGVRSSNITHRKYDTNGNLLWSKDHGDSLYDIAVTRSGECYIVGLQVSTVNIRKIDSSGNVLWSGSDVDEELNYVAVIPTGGAITGSIWISSPRAYQYSSSGSLIWSGISLSNITDLCVDSSSNLWISSELVSGYNIRCYDPSHNLLFSKRYWASNGTDWPFAIATYQEDPWSKQSTLSLTASATLTKKSFISSVPVSLIAAALLTDSLSDVPLSELIGTHLLRSTRWNKYSMLYIGLLTSVDPVVEVTDTNYQRVAIAASDTNWVNSGSGWKNQIAIQFQKWITNQTVVGYALYHSQTSLAPRKVRSFMDAINYTANSAGVVFPKNGLTVTIN